MAYTKEEIQEQKDLITALKTAVSQARATGGVHKFEQGTTRLEKATLPQLQKLLNEEKNTLFRMEDI